MKKLLTALLATVVFAPPIFSATWNAIPASGGETIQPGGPRSGNDQFFNIENNPNSAAFRSYGVLDFAATSIGATDILSSVSSLTLTLTDAPAGFSRPGTFGFYFVTDSTTPYSSLTYDASAAGNVDALGGVNQSQFAPGTEFFYLGSGSYTVGSAGQQYSYDFDLDSDAAIALAEAINAGGNIRFLVTPNNATGATEALTFAGPTGNAPKLSGTYEIVPEPTAAALSAIGIAFIGLARRRRAAR